MSYVTELFCSACGTSHDPDQVHTVCTLCGKPLLVLYDLEQVASFWTPEMLKKRPFTMWRYHEVLPARPDPRYSLGEGGTPLIALSRIGQKWGLSHLWLKDEGQNPTLSFKARGLGMAVSRAYELGLSHLAIPSAGNAAGALAAYTARLGMRCTVFMPEDTPQANLTECRIAGAEIHLVPGTIADAGRALRAYQEENPEVFAVTTLREPYRIEGKKTMGYELFEQFGARLPDVILYPTGGGTGLIGMWKAFHEMKAMGWVQGKLPRMVAVQSTGCAPIVRAYEQGLNHAPPWEHPRTLASGIRVPSALGDFLILKAIRESGGTAVAVSDEAILQATRTLVQEEGLLPAPEGAATLAALPLLIDRGVVHPDDRVVLFNTGSGYKYERVLVSLTTVRSETESISNRDDSTL